MELIAILLVAFIAFDLASLRWGVNSTESIDSREWDRRQYRGAI